MSVPRATICSAMRTGDCAQRAAAGVAEDRADVVDVAVARGERRAGRARRRASTARSRFGSNATTVGVEAPAVGR